ncbi:hypothetical protein GCM10027047_09940 [Rhodococcus aerolatus]
MSTSDDTTGPDGTTEAEGQAPDTALQLDDLSTGPYAHGHGRTADGRRFAFRVRGSTAVVEVYRDGAAEPIPTPEDVAGRASRSVADVDLHENAAVTTLVTELVEAAEPPDRVPDTTVMAFLSRLGSVVDSL